MARKITRKGLIKKLDALCREIVLERDNRTCVQCGSTQKPTWGHVFSRRTYSTRWDLENSFCQCWPCNFRHTKDQYPFFDWFRSEFGQDKLDELRKRFKTTKRWTMGDLEQEYEKLKHLKK